jgi:hypothetical protein
MTITETALALALGEIQGRAVAHVTSIVSARQNLE